MSDAIDFPSFSGKTELLILQSTTFCNIDCNYCYLPGRSKKQVMDLATLRAVLTHLSFDDILARNVQIVWHAGEPLTVGLDYYREAVKIISETVAGTPRLGIQTNGLLVDDEWCRFFKHNNFHVGVSIDGPE